jgi:hypothetical protein
MTARPVLAYLLALAFIAGCNRNGASGSNRDAAADPGTLGGHAGGTSGSSTLGSGGAAGAASVLGGTATAGSSGAGGQTATTGTIPGGRVGTGGRTGGDTGTAAGGTGGTSGTGGVPQGGVSGSSSAGVDADTDGLDAETVDADPKAVYAACRASTDEATCSERGGNWRTYSDFVRTCVCPTSQGGRPCTASSDCLGDCSAWMDPMQGNGAWCQKYAESYTCSSEGGKQGCWCRPESPFAVCIP